MRGTQRTALGIFAITFIAYAFPLVYDLVHKPFFNYVPGQDVASTSLLPMAILQRGDFTLDEYQAFFTTYWRDPHFIANVNGRTVSRSPVAAAVLAVPFYGLPLGTGWIAKPPQAWLSFPWSAFFPAKFASVFISASAVLMFFFCARELTNLHTSTALAIVFAFGTSVWSTATQGLWQQTPSTLFQIIAIWFLLRGHRQEANAAAPAAFFFSAATVSRPNDGLTALLFTLYFFIEFRSAIWRWIAWALPPALFFFAYNAIYNGSPLVFGYQEGVQNYLIAPQLNAFLGLFFSPSRGLFIYSPFLVFALLSLRFARLERERRFYLFVAVAFAMAVLVLSMWKEWDGGWGYGTRMLTDVLPYATLLLVPVATRLQGATRFAFWGLAVYAMVLQSFGLWDYGTRWHWHWNNWIYDIWDIPENEPLFYLKEYIAMAQHYLSVYLLH